ncbi:TPA: hypothetical protein ACH3X1_001949 [Trebouxia sp. C0004]
MTKLVAGLVDSQPGQSDLMVVHSLALVTVELAGLARLQGSRAWLALQQNGVRTARQLANATKPLLLSWGLTELYIDDIKATADRRGPSENMIDMRQQLARIEAATLNTLSVESQLRSSA